MRRWLYYSLAIVVGWIGFFAFISILPVFSGFGTYRQTFWMTVNHWFPWVLLSPPAVWFTWRYPVEWDGWRWRVSAHVLAAVLFVGASAWLSQFAIGPAWPLGRPGEGPSLVRRPPPMAGPGGEREGRAQTPGSGGEGPPAGGPPMFERGRRVPALWMRASFNLPIYLALVSLSHAYLYSRRTQQRERRALELETQLGQARLQALRMQLQPHFLFNTLNAISTLVQTNPTAAQEMIGSLGQMLRLSLDSAPDPEVPLEQELKFLDSYLEIARMRFGDRLAVRFDVAPDTTGALVPTFILQPLVENAIRHGIEPGTGPGAIEIGVHRGGETLSISIRDTGAGLPEGGAGGGRPGGIGLANTKARLETLYPGRHTFVVRNSASGGCVVELEIPFHTEAPAGAGEAGAARPVPLNL